MNQKKEHILNSAMAILKESGDQGLSMRKVAEKSEMRLSNLQYYFKTKELLLAALLEAFLLDYAKSMQSHSFLEHEDPEEQLKQLVLYILNDIETGECAVVFKELWAIAERNVAVKKAIDSYYQDLHIMLFNALEKIASDNCTTQQINSVVGILLPFIEGYCITRSNLRVSTEELSDHLATLLYKLLD
jgi:AcrR family transcriptional regulator